MTFRSEPHPDTDHTQGKPFAHTERLMRGGSEHCILDFEPLLGLKFGFFAACEGCSISKTTSLLVTADRELAQDATGLLCYRERSPAFETGWTPDRLTRCFSSALADPHLC